MRALLVPAFLGCSIVSTSLEAQTLQELSVSPNKDKSAHVTVFADGSVRNVVTQPSDATSATGSIGMTFQGAQYIVTGVVNVLSKSDSVTKGYGATLLPPAAGSAINSGLLDIRAAHAFAHLFGHSECGDPQSHSKACKLGLHFYSSASSSRWVTEFDSNNRPSKVVDVPSWGAGFGPYYTFFDGTINGSSSDDSHATAATSNNSDASHVAMALDVLGVARGIRGDLSTNDGTDLIDRKALLGTGSTAFGGYSIGLNIRYNELNAGLTYYHMGGSIPGLSRGQVVAAIAIRAKLNGGSYSGP